MKRTTYSLLYRLLMRLENRFPSCRLRHWKMAVGLSLLALGGMACHDAKRSDMPKTDSIMPKADSIGEISCYEPTADYDTLTSTNDENVKK